MTEKQIERVRLLIKKHRAALVAEKRKYGGFDDSAGRRYHIVGLYMKIADYKGAITYKRWFDKNFPDDCGSAYQSFCWSVAYYMLGNVPKAEVYALDTAFINVYVHNILLGREVKHVASFYYGYDMLDFSRKVADACSTVAVKPYMEWLAAYVDTEEYRQPLEQYIALNVQINGEEVGPKRSALVEQLYALTGANRAR